MKQKHTKILMGMVSAMALAMTVQSPVSLSQNLNMDAVEKAVSAMQMREIGPALMGGRIAHIEVDPNNPTTWFVAAGSGGVWKTDNAGVTFTPVFDEQKSYSIGTIAIDPKNSDVVWVGTGENVSGRHVGWGDGLYKSLDGGETWTNMGLERSEHIGRILIDPRDSNVVYVAAEGPLWNAGGDRGLYKTTDGGKTWNLILSIDENTGVTDVEFKPGDPDTLYAATYERRRHIWGLMAGGKGAGIHVSTDAGASFKRVTKGLPKGDMGKIGLAVTPADPSLVYATIEANDKEKGFYRSVNSGQSFEKRNSYISGGTGPHYYMEIEASPTDPDTVYQMDVFMRVTKDGGKTFEMAEDGWSKHSDNHALWIDPKNDKHMLIGSDAGMYESFDQGKSWRHFGNMPISQFYKVAADNAEPFYNILVGAQDLGTLYGPSRTMHTDGVRNKDWSVPAGADGYNVAFDPFDNNIQYMEFQEGYMFRVDGTTLENMPIQPKAAPGDPALRFNWDTPIVPSQHVEGRLYTASQFVWKSDDRGNSWTKVSPDLTTNTNRYELGYRGRQWSVDALHDNGAMSQYATLTTMSESALDANLLYVGSDDGLTHRSDDGGANWTKLGKFSGVTDRAFINDIEASLHDQDNVFVVVDAHKVGDYRPLVYKSTNKGRSWRSIAGDLPEDLILWSIQQDHVNPDLLFLGTENGVYASINGGKNWDKMGGTPTIAFRDIVIHRRDNDLIGATFGRGVYIMDDYTALRDLAANGMAAGALPVRDAWWYIPNNPMQAQGQPTLGSSSYRAENPDFGAMIDVYLTDIAKTMKEQRREGEKSLREKGDDVGFPGFDRLTEESLEVDPEYYLEILNEAGQPVRILPLKAKEGLQRVTWDLRYPAMAPIDLSTPGFKPPWASDPEGVLVAPGTYKAMVTTKINGQISQIGSIQSFTVKPVDNMAVPQDYAATAAYWAEVAEQQRHMGVISEKIARMADLLRHMKVAVVNAPRAAMELPGQIDQLGVDLQKLRISLFGDRVKGRLNVAAPESIASRLWGSMATSSREAPTQTQRDNFALVKQGLAETDAKMSQMQQRMDTLEAALEAAGAPSWR